VFVTPLKTDNPVYIEPDFRSGVTRYAQPGEIYLVNEARNIGGIIWDRVKIGIRLYGWIPRVLPPKIGVAPERLTITEKFHFRNIDFYALLLALGGFAWGFFTFQLRPA
jgi:hypothetical protein